MNLPFAHVFILHLTVTEEFHLNMPCRHATQWWKFDYNWKFMLRVLTGRNSSE